MGIFDFIRKPKQTEPKQVASEVDAIKSIIISTNGMIKLQLMISVPPGTSYKSLFQDTFFLGYFYGIHDAAFQKTGHRKPSEQMILTYMLAIGDFCNLNPKASTKGVGEEVFELFETLSSKEHSPIFQQAQIIAGTEYYDLVEGRSKSLVGLMTHFLQG